MEHNEEQAAAAASIQGEWAKAMRGSQETGKSPYSAEVEFELGEHNPDYADIGFTIRGVKGTNITEVDLHFDYDKAKGQRPGKRFATLVDAFDKSPNVDRMQTQNKTKKIFSFWFGVNRM